MPIDKLAYKGLPNKAPELVDMLRSMNVGLEPLNSTLAWANDNGLEDSRTTAIYYLQNFENRWSTWVTPKAYEQIKEALETAEAPTS